MSDVFLSSYSEPTADELRGRVSGTGRKAYQLLARILSGSDKRLEQEKMDTIESWAGVYLRRRCDVMGSIDLAVRGFA